MADLSRIGSDVLFYSSSYRDFPMGPRSARIVGLGGDKDRYNVQVFNDNGRDPMRQPVEFVRNVPMVKADAENKPTHYLIAPAGLPKNGDWTIPRTVQDAPPKGVPAGAVSNK